MKYIYRYNKLLLVFVFLVGVLMASNVFGAAFTPAPSIYYLGASPTSIVQGGASTISWNVVNSYTCYGSGGWSGLKSIPSGSTTVTPSSTTTYTLTCNNEVGATTSRSLTINVSPKTISTANTCSCYNTGVQCSITDNGTGCTVVDTTGTSVSYCQPGTLVTTTQPYCTPTMTATASPSSLTLSSGSSASTTITMNGSNLAGNLQLGTDPATANVGMSLSNYNPPTIPMPQTVTLTITASNLSKTGYVTVSINYGGATSYMLNIPVTVNTATPAPTVTLTTNGTTSTTITTSQTASLSWSGTNSTSCSGVSSKTSSTATTLSDSNVPYSNSLGTYNLYQSCTGPGGTTTSSPVTVTVTQAPTPTCGSSNGGNFYTAPTTNLCSNGTASAVTGTGPWNWTCSASGASASCSANKKVDGLCSSSHYACIQGASANNVNGASAWTWNCLGSNGGTTASCTENKVITTGNLTPVASGCTILANASSCNIQFSWSTTNPVGTSSVTSDTTDAGAYASNTLVAVGNFGSYVSFVVPYLPYPSPQHRNFYLYNNANLLDQKTVTSTCASGTTWNGSVCYPNAPTTPTGLTATAVSSSQINTSWSASTGGNGSQIAYNIYRCQGAGCTPNSYIGWGYTTSFSDTGLSSNTTYGYRILAYDSRPVFSSYSSAAYATTLAGVPVVNCSTSPSSISYGGTSTLSWSATDATSCTLSSGGGLSGTQATSGSQSVGPLNSTTTYSFTCSGPGGSGSCTTSVAVGAPPTGTVSATPCSIALGSSTCSSSVSWSVSNPITGAQTAVTKDNPNGTVPNSNTTSGTKWVSVDYGMTNFGLWHNGSNLVSTSVNAQCSQGALIGGVCALVPVNGSCSSPATHYTCSSGTSTNNVNGLTAWTWNCAGSNGGSTASCSETKGSGSLMSGTLSAPSCAISAGSNSCNTTMTWSTANPVGTSAVTSSYPSANTTVATGDSGSQSVSITYPSRDLYLYNFGSQLAVANPTATCTVGTTWNTTTQKCQNIPPPSPTATIIANPTSVVKGSSSTISWSSTNASSCTGTNFSTGNATSGQVTVTPNNTTTYSLVCTGVATQASDQATVTVTVNPKKPKYIEQ